MFSICVLFQLVQQEELMTKLRDDISGLQTDLAKSTDDVSINKETPIIALP